MKYFLCSHKVPVFHRNVRQAIALILTTMFVNDIQRIAFTRICWHSGVVFCLKIAFGFETLRRQDKALKFTN